MVRDVLKTNFGEAIPFEEQSSAIWRGLSLLFNSLSTAVNNVQIKKRGLAYR